MELHVMERHDMWDVRVNDGGADLRGSVGI